MPSAQTISSTDIVLFAAGNKIKSAEMNSNFGVFRGHFLPVATNVSDTTSGVYDLGFTSGRWRRAYVHAGMFFQESITANPPAGYNALFFKPDGFLYKADVGGTVSVFLINPMTTKGDLIGNNGGTAALPIGKDGQYLVADSASSMGFKWKYDSIQTKTTTYAATIADDLILADTSGGAWSLALFTAVGNGGKEITVIKITSDLNVLTVDPNGTETVGGALTYAQKSQFEAVTYVSDNANWYVKSTNLNRQAVSARYTSTSGQSISNNSLTIIDFATKTEDLPGAAKVTTGSSWHFTCDDPGIYLVMAGVIIGATSANSAQIYVYKGGAIYSRLDRQFVNATDTINISGFDTVRLAVGDTIDFRVLQVAGSSQVLSSTAGDCHCAIVKVSN